jgi:hypothetical protein
MKTIGELNSKVWYRLLKVIYVLIFIPIFILSFFSGYLSTKPEFDNEKSYIKCDDGREFGLDENGIYLYSSYVYSEDNEKIKQMCSSNELDEIAKKYGGYIILEKNYKLISVYENRDWFRAIKISLLSIIGAIFFFELIKRVFYYIVLGSFRPPK